MFEDEVYVDKKNELRYGTTKKPAHETMNEIMQLLTEYDCERIVTDYEGDTMRLGFIYEGKPYKITIPKVYIRGEYEEKIGVRVVYHFLKMVLSWTKQGIVSLNKALMSGRMVKLQGKTVSLGEASEALEDGKLSSTIQSEVDKLPESSEDEDTQEAEYEVIDDEKR